MTNKNCLNCVFLDKANKCCSIEKDYESIATWGDCYKKELTYPINLISAKDIRRIYED